MKELVGDNAVVSHSKKMGCSDKKDIGDAVLPQIVKPLILDKVYLLHDEDKDFSCAW